MPERHGKAFWPGVLGCISCRYTANHGITPGIASITIPEQDPGKIPPMGDLVITDNNGVVRLRRCRIISWDFGGGAGTPRTITLHIADRRWMWAYGVAWGDWNQIDPQPDPMTIPEGEFIASGGPWMPGTYRPAFRMMADLLALLYEVHPLITPPPDVPVSMKWNGMKPAQALAALCDELDYVIAYQPIADRILLTPRGIGATLPNLIPISSSSVQANLPTLPTRLELHGGETLFNDYLKLEPCAPERNGEIRKLDDLSYRPAEGWSRKGYPPFFGGIPAGDNMTEEETIALAQQNVWKMYRVVDDTEDNPIAQNVPEFGDWKIRKQIILNSVLYGLSKDAQGQLRTEPPYCIGSVYFPKGFTFPPGSGLASPTSNTTFAGRLPLTFNIDTTRNVVIFDRYVYQAVEGNPFPPELFLRTSFKMRNMIGLLTARYIVGGPTGAVVDPLCPPAIVHHPEMVKVVNVVRESTSATTELPSFAIADVATNLDELLPLANYYLQAALREYELDAAGTIQYPGIIGLEPDGAIAQVTWQVGGGAPAMTTASRNTEHTYYLPTAKERRTNERFISIEAQMRRKEQERGGPPKADK